VYVNNVTTLFHVLINILRFHYYFLQPNEQNANKRNTRRTDEKSGKWDNYSFLCSISTISWFSHIFAIKKTNISGKHIDIEVCFFFFMKKKNLGFRLENVKN
jgi:hypothetical protein